MAGFLKEFFKPRSPATADRIDTGEGASQQAAERAGQRVQTDPDAVRNATSIDELEHLAVHASTAGQRRAAVDRIEDSETLSRVARALKGRDKGAFQHARQKLRAIQQAEEQAHRRNKEIERVIADMQSHAETLDTKLYQARLDSLHSRWEALRDHADSDQTSRFEAATAKSQERASAIASEQANETELQRRAEQQQGTVATLEATLTQLRSGYPEEGASPASLDAITRTQITRWEEATAQVAPDPQLAQAYEAGLRELQDYQRALDAWQQHESAVKEALENGARDQLTRLLETIGWPETCPGPPELRRARTIAQASGNGPDPGGSSSGSESHGKASKDTEAELTRTLDQLEETLEKQQLKPSRQLFRQAQKLQDELPARVLRQHQARVTRLGRQVQELRDWLGFAARPKLEALCEQMEYLADQPMEPEAKAEHIRELQHSWYDLGGTPDQQLWQRFKSATDRAYEPCHEYFSEKNRLKSANLAKREHLVEQLQEFVDNLDWSSCDYKAVDRIQRTARREWSDAKPVDFRYNQPLQKRFDRLIKTINAELDAERERNEARKQDIVARAEALVEHEPLREATENAKALQKEWESIGITRHSEDRRLWKAFRAACDRIFERVGREREAQEQSRNAAAQEADALIGQLETLDPASVEEAELRRYRDAFNELELPRDRINAFRDRFQKALDGVQDERFEALRRERYDQWVTALEKHRKGEPVPPQSFRLPPLSPETATHETALANQARALCIRVEIVTNAATPPQDQAQRMALQVNRLNEGIRGDQSIESQWDEIDSLLATWCELDLAEAIEGRYYERLAEALKHWFHQSAQQ